MPRAREAPTFAVLLQEYFCQRLIAQRDASPATVASYRDTFRLLLGYARDRTRKTPTDLLWPSTCRILSSWLQTRTRQLVSFETS